MIVLIFITIMIILISYKKYKNVYNPATLFSVIWLVVFSLYSLKLLDYYELSKRSYIVLFIQMVAFSIGCFAADYRRISFRKKKKYEPRLWLIYIFAGVTIANLLSETLIQIQSLINGMSFYQIAAANLIQENNSTGWMVLLKVFVVFPTVYGISAITASLLMSGVINKVLIVLNVVIVALYTLQHGARSVLILMLLTYLFAFLIGNKHKNIDKKTKYLIVSFVVLVIFVSSWLTDSRGVENVGIHIYRYLSETVVVMDQWLKRIDSAGIITYGLTSLGGFIYPIFLLLKGTGIISIYPATLDISRKLLQATEIHVPIGTGSNMTANAFVGTSFAFYADGGYLFVAIGLFIYGYICMNTFILSQRKNDLRLKAISLFLLVTVATSFMRYPFVSYNYGMVLWLYLIFYKRKEIN